MKSVQELEKLYLEAKEKYYIGEPIMSDFEFDTLEQELMVLDSQVINIIGQKVDRNAKFPHITPMLSLDKIQTDKLTGEIPTKKFMDWFKPLISIAGENISVTPKYDGNAANCIYKNGKLWKVLSRGNGQAGRDYTNKLRKHIPETITALDTVEIRGEVLITKEIFAKKYSQFKNERNMVAGILNNDKASEDILNDLVFMAYEVKQTEGKTTEYIPTKILTEWSFNKKYKLPEFCFHYTEFEDIYKKLELYKKKESPFLLDGFVIKTPEVSRNEIGEKEHHPLWAIAVKWQSTECIATIVDIEWNISKTGNFTPVAILEPVDLDGSIVSRVSCYNYGYVKENNLQKGTKVILIKSGDIIPTIVKVLN